MTDQVAVELVARFETFRTGLGQAGEFLKGVVSGMRDEFKRMSQAADQETNKAGNAMSGLASKVKESSGGIEGAVGKLRGAWAGMAAVVGAGMLAKKGIDESVQLTVETQKLARALNMGATEANNWRIAIGDVYGSTDEFITLTQAMNRQLKNNEDGLKAMGLATRDANGDFRDQKDLVLDALGVLREYKAGTDRNLAAQELFGRGVSVTSELLDLNAQRIDDAKEKAEALGAVVGQENVEAVSAYRAAMNDAGDVVEALWKAVGDMLMPIMTELANFLAENGPDAVRAMKIAVGVLATAFDGLAFAAQSTWAVIKAGIQSIGTLVGGFSIAITKAFSGDFAGAKAELGFMASAVKDNFGAAYDTILKKAEGVRERLFARVSGNTTEAKGQEGGGKSYEGKGDKEDDSARKAALAAERERQRELERIRKEAFQARMVDLKSELDEWRNNYDERLRIARKMAEETRAMFGEDSKEYKKAAAEIVKIERAKAEQIARVLEVEKEAKIAAAYAGVDAAEQASELEYQLGEISLQQRLASQQQFEDQRYQIARQALEDRLLLMSKDPDMNPEEYARIKNEILNLEIQHRQMLREIGNQQIINSATPANNIFQSMEQGFASSLQGMLTRAQTWRQALTNLYRQVFASYLQEMIAKPLAQMAMRAIRETAIGRLIATQSVMMQRMASGQSMQIKATETTANVAKDAVQAGAGGAKAMAGIPYVGPVLALAAMAALFAAVMSLGGGGGGGGSSTSVSRTEVPSAAGGFDIPAGLNPLTQLHEREMVLPAEHADAIRGMAGGGIPPISISISALDGASVKKVLLDNKSALAQALRSAARDFSRG